MEKTGITVHCIVCNEDHFIWFALKSVLPYADKIIVFDTGSTDRTVAAIAAISDKKIIFTEKGAASREKLPLLRQEMITQTVTPFFLILDGDEIWPEASIEKMVDATKNLPKEKIAIVCRTRNCVGDVWHYSPEDAGRYNLAGQKGHLAMRLFRNVPGLSVSGRYPLESYMYGGKSLNDQQNRLEFLDVWYLHATHLTRSSSNKLVLGFRQQKLETGIKMKREELPEILFKNRPSFVPDPLEHRSFWYDLAAKFVTPIKQAMRDEKS